jgi:hypothetical protein
MAFLKPARDTSLADALPPLRANAEIVRLEELLAFLRKPYNVTRLKLEILHWERQAQLDPGNSDNKKAQKAHYQRKCAELRTELAQLTGSGGAGQASPAHEADGDLPPATRMALRIAKNEPVPARADLDDRAALEARLEVLRTGVDALQQRFDELRDDLSLEVHRRLASRNAEAHVAIYEALARVADAVDAKNEIASELVKAGYQHFPVALDDGLSKLWSGMYGFPLNRLGSLKDRSSLISAMREYLREEKRLR